MPRPKHSDKDLEQVLRDAEQQGWRVDGGGKNYFKMKCPCADKHLKMVHLSPSGTNYLKNLVNYLEKRTCWNTE